MFNKQYMGKKFKSIDPILLEVIWNRLISVVNQQAATLVRTSFTPVVSEAEDLAAAIFDEKGRMLAQSIRGTPGHINSTANCVKEFLKIIPKSNLAEGDVLITNDPWKTSGHLNDITIVTPIFYKKVLIAFFANTCHSVDIGGRPMSAEAKDVYEEGLWLPPLKFFQAGKPNEDVFNIIKNNVRNSIEMLGDLYAQVSANEVGARELMKFIKEFSLNDLSNISNEIINRSENSIKTALKSWPNGVYFNESTSDGFDNPINIVVKITVTTDEVLIDYTGTAPQSLYGINVVSNYSHAYSIFALKCLTAPYLPNNEGSFKPFKIFAPTGCILNAVHPAPVAARHTIGQLLPSTIFGALADVIPKKVTAEGYDADWTIQPIAMDPNSSTLFHLVWTGGTGARFHKDGLSTTAFPARSQSVPVEIVEDRSPLFFLRKELINDSGGPGKYRGGCGQIIQFEINSKNPYFISPKCERTMYAAAGLQGGLSGSKGELLINKKKIKNSKKNIEIQSGTNITLKLPGGGGYGDPLERSAKSVLKDVVNGIVTKRSAKNDYGVVIEKKGSRLEILKEETNFLRQKLRK